MPVRLLLIEDNPGDAVIFREKLDASPLDAAVVHAVRLKDALDHLGDGGFDLVLVDLSLPDTDGLETVDRVREAAPHLPLIVLTGLDDAVTAAEAKKRGAVDYLVKWYVDSDSLARYIRYAIEQHRLMGGGWPAPAQAAPAEAPAETPAPVAAEPRGDGARGTPAAPARAAEAPAAAAVVVEEDRLVPALEAALAVTARTAALAEHLAGSLRAALDLVQGAEATHREPFDVLVVVQQAVDRAHARALHNGIPVRLQSARRRVVAAVDRRVLGEALERLLALALDTGGAAGVALDVAAQRGRSEITATWELRRGAALPEPDDPLLALDLALCHDLATRAGGGFSLRVDGREATAVLALDAAADA